MTKNIIRIGLVAAIFGAIAGSAFAFHSWGYHWARASNPFTLKVGDNVTTTWDSYFNTSITDWSASSVLELQKTVGASNPKTCKGVTGRVEVCNSKYGANGWLGIATVWITGGEHITKGTVKLNDTYFNTSKYNTAAWRNMVMCQEIGHTLGLDHQDEAFDNANLGTCMDYTSDPSTNQHPNAHDYEELEAIYSHLDTTTTILSSGLSGPGRGALSRLEENSDLGKALKFDSKGRASVFARSLGKGEMEYSFVIWAD